MKFSALILLGVAVIASASSCPGSKQCQCLFPDRSHCCLYGRNLETGDADTYDCTTLCAAAVRELQDDEDQGTACNAGGAYTCASLFTSQGRDPCYNNNEIPGSDQP